MMVVMDLHTARTLRSAYLNTGEYPDLSRESFVFRVMSYNIHSCVNANRDVNPRSVAEIINTLNADIVALQEVDQHKPASRNRNQAKTISRMLNLDHVYFPVEEKGLHAFGLAVLSRFPLVDWDSDRLPNLYPKLKPRKRGAIRVTLRTSAGPIHLLNTHLSLFKLERRKQLNFLLKKNWLSAMAEHEPFILCGDLNAGPLSATYRKLSRHLVDVQKALHEPHLPQPTFHSRSPVFRIDHIFVSEHLAPLKVEVNRTPDTETASDHLPLVAELALKKCKQHSALLNT
jgi:endonuclease/exonuclease/phosphatase family metal-dependent hydrolase